MKLLAEALSYEYSSNLEQKIERSHTRLYTQVATLHSIIAVTDPKLIPVSGRRRHR